MANFVERPTILSMRVNVDQKAAPQFVDWQARFNAAIAAAPGFTSLEFISSRPDQSEWLIVQRFNNAKSASEWNLSGTKKRFLEELQSGISINGVKEETADEKNVTSGITEVFVARVNPEKEDAFRAWCAKIHQAEARFPGFRGVYLQSPGNKNGNWITLLQFDNMDHLDRWLQSKERQEILKESESLVSSMESHRVISPFAGWFSSLAKVGQIPPAWKQSMVVLLVLFPIVMLEFKYLSPLTNGLGISLSTFIGNALSVALLAFPMTPLAIWLLRWWLSPGVKNYRSVTILGTLLVLLLYLIEIYIFWI